VDCEQAAPVESFKESKADQNPCYGQANFASEAPLGWDKEQQNRQRKPGRREECPTLHQAHEKIAWSHD
jgi:hypothetical protein